MEIKVLFRGAEVGKIDFDIYKAIALFRKHGYASFTIRSQCKIYDYFASFKNEDTDNDIYLYPDRGCAKSGASNLSYDELSLIKEIIDRTSYEIKNSEESE